MDGQVAATYQDGVEALDVRTGETSMLRYKVKADLLRADDAVSVFGLTIMHMSGAMDYTFRPGAKAMRAIRTGIAKKVATEFPWAKRLILSRLRSTQGYGVLPDGGGKRNNLCQNKEFDLTRFR